MSAQLNPIGAWVDQLLNELFFQPDDGLALKIYDEQVAPDFLARINHDHFDFNQYKESVKQARTKYDISIQSNSEILKWDDAEQKGGAVAHLSKFTLKDKATGQEIKQTSLVLTAVRWVDGKRVLTEMTEVTV